MGEEFSKTFLKTEIKSQHFVYEKLKRLFLKILPDKFKDMIFNCLNYVRVFYVNFTFKLPSLLCKLNH